MKMQTLSARAAATAAALFAASVPAGAQTLGFADPSPVSLDRPVHAGPYNASSFSSANSGSRDTWRTVALVSGIVMIFGLVDDDPTLTILGGVGLLCSLYESGQFGYQYRHGVDLIGTGPVSFGVNPRGEIGYSNGVPTARPTAFVQWKIKL